MATGILLGRNPAPVPPFQPPTSYGVNRVPRRKPLDPEKLLDLGLDLINRAQGHTTKACDHFKRLDEFARMNRDRLEDEDVITVLTDLREDAEVLLERGFYSLDVALEIMTRLRRPAPEFGEVVTAESSARWRACFQAMAGVYAGAYMGIHDMVIAVPTCGDLSHVPPKLHFDESAEVAVRRYHLRQLAAEMARLPAVLEYWRWRLVKGVGAGALPGVVAFRDDPPQVAQGNTGDDADDTDDGYGDTTWAAYNTSLQNDLLGLAGSDLISGSFDVHSITEDSIVCLAGTPDAASTPKGSLRPPSTPGNVSGLDLLLQAALEADPCKSTGAQDGEASSKRKLDANASGPVAKKTKLDESVGPVKSSKRKAGTETDGAPARKRPRGPGMIVIAGEGEDTMALTKKELARLPWNKNKPAPAAVHRNKYVSIPAGTSAEGLGFLANLRAWARGEPAEDSTVAGLGDAMNVEELEPTFPVGDCMVGTVVGQGTGCQPLQTPSQHPSADDPDLSLTIATPKQFEDHRDQEPSPPVLTAIPTILEDSHAGLKSSHLLPPPAKHPPNSRAPPKHLHVPGRDDTPAVFKQWPHDKGEYSSQLNSTAFGHTSPERDPASPSLKIITETFLGHKDSSLEQGPYPSLKITTDTFLGLKDSSPEREHSPTPDPTPSKPPRKPSSSPSVASPQGEPDTPPAIKVAENRSSPNLPSLGGKPDTDASAKSPDDQSADGSGLCGSTELQMGGVNLDSVEKPSEAQNLSSSEPSSGVQKTPIPKRRDRPSSEPSTGASKTPIESRSDESASGDEGTILFHFPAWPPQKRPVTPPQRPSPDGNKDPPVEGGGESDASIDSADRRAIDELLQADLDEEEASSLLVREEYSHLVQQAKDAGLDWEGRTVSELRDDSAAMQSGVPYQVKDLPSEETEGEARSEGGEGGPKGKGETREGVKKKSEQKGAVVRDGAYWLARSNAKPVELGEQEVLDGSGDTADVWDI